MFSPSTCAAFVDKDDEMTKDPSLKIKESIADNFLGSFVIMFSWEYWKERGQDRPEFLCLSQYKRDGHCPADRGRGYDQ